MLKDRSASSVLPQSAKFNAFRMSSVTTRQYFFVPPFHLVTAMALEAMLVTLSIASSVDFAFRKPY